MKGHIRKILNSSAVDGPGNRMVIFFQGCNFNCTYCHNPETIEVYNPSIKVVDSTENNDNILSLNIDGILDRIKKIKSFISGVTVSGGECTLQYEFLLELAKKLREEKISLYVDTNGLLSSDKMEILSQYVDKFMLDIKAVNNDDHFKITGVTNELVLENLDLLASSDKLYEVRSVIVPNEIDNETTVRYVSEVIKKYDSNIRYKLIQYRNYGVREPFSSKYNSPSSEYMNNLKDIAESNGLNNIILT